MAQIVQIQMRRDSAADWAAANPTLASGEWGYETDTNRIKIGDGATAWTSLAYFAEAGAVSSVNGNTGVVVIDPDDLDDSATTNKFATSAQLAKVDYLTITQAVDLDAIETRVNQLDAAVVLQGSWDASAGTFPGSGSAQAGDSYIVSVGGTVDGEVFTANDRILAITDNASTATYASNWLKLDYTDAVLSVAGKTGAVTLEASDIASGTFSIARGGTGAATAADARVNLEIHDLGPNAQTGTAYTLVLADRGLTVTMDNASANTLTIPANAAVAFDVGTVINVIQIGAGVTTIEGDTGVTVNGVSAGSGAINTQYQGVSIIKTATDTWIASGDIATVA